MTTLQIISNFIKNYGEISAVRSQYIRLVGTAKPCPGACLMADKQREITLSSLSGLGPLGRDEPENKEYGTRRNLFY